MYRSFFPSIFPRRKVTVKFKHQDTCVWWQNGLWRKALKYLYIKGNFFFPWKKMVRLVTTARHLSVLSRHCHRSVFPRGFISVHVGCICVLRGPDHLTHTRKRHAFYTRLQFLGRKGWLCPWSAHRTLLNINVLFKNASFTSKVARWAALEPTGKLQGRERSSWLLFYCTLLLASRAQNFQHELAEKRAFQLLSGVEALKISVT